MAGTLYTPDILRMAANIPHLGRLEKPDASVDQRAPVCGSHILVDLILDADGNVADFAQQVRTCALGQASAYLLGTHIIGASAAQLAQMAADLEDWLSGSRQTAPNWPGISVLEEARAHPGRHGAICLPFKAAALAAQRAAS